MIANTFNGANRAAWKQTANRLRVKEIHRNRWWERRQCCKLKSTWEIPAERCKQTRVPSAYLHQSYQRRHGCNILPQLHLLLPGSTNSHSGLSCISAYSLSTWLASGEERRDRADEGKNHQCRKKKKIKRWGGFERVLRQLQLWDHQTGRDGGESLEKKALEKLPSDSNVLSATATAFTHYSVPQHLSTRGCRAWMLTKKHLKRPWLSKLRGFKTCIF